MNSQACRERAMFTRSASGTKVSSVRVITTRYLPVFSICSRSSSENSSTIDFSSSPLAARVPLSMPPWPGIEDDQRPRVRLFVRRAGPGCAAVAGVRRAVLERDGAHEGLAIDGGQVEHQPGRLVVVRFEHERPLDSGRASPDR